MQPFYDRSYFFDQGIRFQCIQCGACCTGEPGIVALTGSELTKIAEYLNATVDALLSSGIIYKNLDHFRISETLSGACRYYDKGCKIYPVRPRQCRTFPFWFKLLRSLDTWRRIMPACPGIGQGTLWTKEQILERIDFDVNDVLSS